MMIPDMMTSPPPPAKPARWKLYLRRSAWGLLGLAGVSILLVLALRWLPIPGSAVMLERKVSALMQGESLDIQYQWRDWNTLSDDLKMAVIAGEDQKFAWHWGFDLPAIEAAWTDNEAGGTLRGASTLSQQVAKNLFLWSDRSWLRKILEAWFTLWLELLWPKERILEVYLNIAEWGEGIFGAEAATQFYFHRNAGVVSRQQACLLAAVLPNPIQWSPLKPGSHVAYRARWIDRQISQLGGHDYLDRMAKGRPWLWQAP